VAKLEDQLNDIIINMIRVSTATKEAQAWAEVQSKRREIEDAERKVQEVCQQRNRARMDCLIKETERYVKFRQIKDYIEIIAAEGRKRLGEAYPSSDFSRWVEWAELYLKENGPDTWGLPKFDVPDNQWSTRMPSTMF